MPTLMVNNDLHTLIKQYCIFKDKGIQDFIEEELTKNKKLLEFRKKIKDFTL